METDHGTQPAAAAGATGAGDRVGVREAAGRLGVNPSTVSRQLKTLGVRVDAEKKFSFEAYVAARAAQLNPLHDRGTAAVDGTGQNERRSFEGGEPAPAAPSIGGQGALHSAHTAEKLWRAKSAQLAYEEKIGALCEKRGAVDAGIKTGETLLELLRDRRRRLAEEIAPVTDVGTVEAILVREDALFMANLQETMKRLLQVMEGGNVAAA